MTRKEYVALEISNARVDYARVVGESSMKVVQVILGTLWC